MLKPMTSVADCVVVFHDTRMATGLHIGTRVYLGRAADHTDVQSYRTAQTAYCPDHIDAWTCEPGPEPLMVLADALAAAKTELASTSWAANEGQDYSISLSDEGVDVKVHFASEEAVCYVLLQLGVPLHKMEIVEDCPVVA